MNNNLNWPDALEKLRKIASTFTSVQQLGASMHMDRQLMTRILVGTVPNVLNQIKVKEWIREYEEKQAKKDSVV